MSPKRVLASECIIETPRLGVYREKLENPDGSEIERLRVTHPGAVIILALTDAAEVVMVKQFRHAVQTELLEVPAGTLEAGEVPLDCAKRELEEETGYRAALWTSIGTLYPAPGFCNEIQHLFLAEELSAGTFAPESAEEIEVVTIPITEILQIVSRDEISDGKTLAALFRLQAIRPHIFG